MLSAPLRRQLGIALLAGSTLLAELILTRVLSAGLYHHIAFVVLSTALLGTGVAAVVVSLRAGAGLSLEPLVGPSALAFALGLPLCFSACQWLAAEPLLLAEDPAQVLRMGLTYVLLALPFFFAGLSIAALLSAHTRDAPALYGADLMGAAAGSLLGLFAVQLAHGQDALLIASAGAAGSAGMLWASKPSRRWVLGLVGALTLLCVLRLGLSSAPWLPLHISASKVTRGGELFSKVLRDARHTRSTRWTPGARVDRVRFSAGQERLIIDAGTAAVRVPPAGFRPAPSDSSLVYELAPQGRFLIIGAGAGWEVAEALALGANHVDAIELNPAVAAAMPALLRSDPRVNLVVDEGRSYAERAAGPYDAVVMVHTISNAASASGALHLAEDYLFTTEALRQMFALLRPQGFVFITRPEAQLPRLLNTLRAASESRGPLRARSVVWAERAQANSFYGAVLAGPRPIAAAPLTAIRRRIHDRRGLRLIASPKDPPQDPLFAAIYAQPFDPAKAAALSPSVLTPPTDDRPFFNQRRRLSALSWRDLTNALSSQGRARMALEDQPIAELSSLIVLLESILVGTLALLVPILWGRRRQRSGPAPSVLVYFAGLGLGFMLLEVSLIQRLGLLLGAPALSIAVVFTGLLVGAGLGSMAAPRWPRPRWAVLAAAIWSLILAFLLPAIGRYGLAWSSEARIPLAFMISGLTGLALGAPFPLGLQRLRAEWVPWAFAVNAFTSVAATVLALLLAAELGFFWVTIAAAAAYGLAAASFMSAHSTETGPA